MSSIIVTNTTSSGIEINDLYSFEITASGTETLSDYFSSVEIANSDNFIEIGVQEEIVSILSSIDSKIKAEKLKETALKEFFNSAIKNIMTGELRVKDFKIEVENV